MLSIIFVQVGKCIEFNRIDSGDTFLGYRFISTTSKHPEQVNLNLLCSNQFIIKTGIIEYLPCYDVLEKTRLLYAKILKTMLHILYTFGIRNSNISSAT